MPFLFVICSRGLTPPHRVKSISMATFTQDDVDFLKNHGNDECAKTWLGLWDPKRVVHQDQRELMIDKYERKRYYLEPASPLKSLTNAVSLKSGSVAATAAGIGGVELATTSGTRSSNTPTSNGNNTYKSNGDGQIDLVHVPNGFGQNGHNAKQQQFRHQNAANAERSFKLTPPSTQRTTMNGLHKAVTGATASAPSSSGKSTSVINRPHQQQNGYSHLQDAFMQKCNNMNNNNNNNNNNSHELSVLHIRNSRMSDSSSSTSVNGFGADADFVADFGSANIFDATTTSNRSNISSPPILNGNSNAISSNGYARIQPLKKQHQQQQQQQQYQLLNGHGQSNGNGSHSEVIANGSTENFADFEHAPIFNAAVDYKFVRKTVIKRCAGGQQTDGQHNSRTSSRTTEGSDVEAPPAPQTESAAEFLLDKNLYADIRQATTHSEISEPTANSIAPSGLTNSKDINAPILSPPKSAQTSHIQTRGMTLQNTVTELTLQLDAANAALCSMQASCCDSCPSALCPPLAANLNEAQCRMPSQAQVGFCNGNMPPMDWCQYANSAPRWPPNNASGAGVSIATVASQSANVILSPNQMQPQQPCPPMYCPQPNSYDQAAFAAPCRPNPPCPPLFACPPPVEQQPDVTVAGLSYGALPQQTLINTAQNRTQNGSDANAEACMESTPSYSTLYNRSYCQPPVAAYTNPFIQPTQMQMQPAPMPVPPECYNPFHPYCVSGNCSQGCMPSNTIPVGDPIIDPSCNVHSAYDNCLCKNWCLPIPNNNNTRTINNQHNNSHNNNNALSSTPSEDRYAALKDLDEQLRESKAAAATVVNSAYTVMDAFGNTVLSNGVNPFKHQQANPFQAATHGTSPTATQNYFGQMTVISNGNGQPSQQATNAAQQFYNNYSNGFGNAATTTTTNTAPAMFPHTAMSAGPSGCGFGLGALQPTVITATGAGGGTAFNNPFGASGGMNTNNPFL
ncbi:unnamed protein product [Ceratitis capitata]|nr:unnamed protein product [Ceratitis capitata]